MIQYRKEDKNICLHLRRKTKKKKSQIQNKLRLPINQELNSSVKEQIQEIEQTVQWSQNGKKESISEAGNIEHKNNGNPSYILEICKREQYIDAWKQMYSLDKKKWNHEMFDGINPMLNKTLSTETDNFAVVVYESTPADDGVFNIKGKPVGIFSMVVTERNGNVKPIGKQFIVDPDHQGKGIGKAMLLALENELKTHGYDWYYIGCSTMSARILKSFGHEPYEVMMSMIFTSSTLTLTTANLTSCTKNMLRAESFF